MLLQWLSDSPSSPLLHSLLSAACLQLVALPELLAVSEACCDAHFSHFTPGQIMMLLLLLLLLPLLLLLLLLLLLFESSFELKKLLATSICIR